MQKNFQSAQTRSIRFPCSAQPMNRAFFWHSTDCTTVVLFQNMMITHLAMTVQFLFRKVLLPAAFYIPCLKEKDKNIDTRIPDTDKIRLLYPLSEDAVLLQFSENADGKSLLLLTAEDKKLCLSVIDKAEGKLLQKILLKHTGKETFHPDAANSYISDRDSHILITENDSVYLLRKSGRKYSLLLSGSYREKLNYTKRDIPYFPYFDFDGESWR